MTAKKTTRRKSTKKASKKTPAKDAPEATASGGPVTERVRMTRPTYSANKDAIKKPIRKEKLKWKHLGTGKGQYARDGVSVFVVYGDDFVDFTMKGEDADAIQGIIAAWKDALGADALTDAPEENAAEEQVESAPDPAVLAWRVGRPVQQPGEPESWYGKRLAAWEGKKPPGA